MDSWMGKCTRYIGKNISFTSDEPVMDGSRTQVQLTTVKAMSIKNFIEQSSPEQMRGRLLQEMEINPKWPKVHEKGPSDL